MKRSVVETHFKIEDPDPASINIQRQNNHDVRSSRKKDPIYFFEFYIVPETGFFLK